MNNLNRIFIFLSLASTIISAIQTEEMCYFCDPAVAIIVFLLHLLLLIFSFLHINNRVLNVLIFTLLLFYVSRVGTMQFDLSYYSYPNLPTIGEMTEALALLLIASTGLLLGCVYQKKDVQSTERIFLHHIPKNLEARYYMTIVWIVIISQSVIIINTIISGAGLAISLAFIDIISLRISKFAHLFDFLSIIPIAWIILRKPKGIERKLTMVAISLFCVSRLMGLSKVAFIYMIIPFIIVYYLSGRPLTRKVKQWSFIAICVTFIFAFQLMSFLRSYITDVQITGANVMAINYSMTSDLILGVLHRVGMSFDVLTLVVAQNNAFVTHANLLGEFIDIINGYVPGDFIEAVRVPWSQILYSIGSGADLLAMLDIGTGENITLIGHLAIYFGWLGIFLICFALMMLHSILYAHNDSIIIRSHILIAVFLGISNGSGLVQSVSSVPFVFLYMYLVHLCIIVFLSIKESLLR